MTTSVKWSYSGLSLYQQCPKKYFHLKVAKDFKEPETEALSYGTKVHEAAEFYIRDGKPIPPEFSYMQEILDKLKELPGEKLCEHEMGLARDLSPVGFKDKDVWWRGIADLVVLDDDRAFLVDYKTGKSSRYADTKQLEILSLALFKHFPQIKKVKAGLLFVVAKDFVKADYKQETAHEAWVKWLNETMQMEASYENNVWNAKPNFTCKNYCAVTSCPHNGRGEYR
jgi:hypothetical protein